MVLFYDVTKSYILLVVGLLIYSFDSTLVLLNYNLTEWTIVFWRQLFQLCTVFLLIVINMWHRRRNVIAELYGKFQDIGVLGLIASFVYAICGTSYVIACMNTYTANVFLIYACAPILVAILGYFFVDEAVQLKTIIAGLVCLICVGWIFYTDLAFETGGNNDDVGSQGHNWYGNLMALVSTISFSVFYVLLRKAVKNPDEEVDMIPVQILSSLIQCVAALAFGVDFASPSKYNYIFLFLQGGVELPVFDSVTTWASKYIPAAEMQLIMLLDNILQPIWVYVFGFSTPPIMTLILGSVMFVTLIIHSYLSLVLTHSFTYLLTHLLTQVDEHGNKKVTRYMLYNSIVDTDLEDEDDDIKSFFVETPTRRLKNKF